MIKKFKKFNLLIDDVKQGEKVYYKIHIKGSPERLNAALYMLNIKDKYYDYWKTNGYTEKDMNKFTSKHNIIYFFFDNRGSIKDPNRIPFGNGKFLLINPFVEFPNNDKYKIKARDEDFRYGGEINMDDSEVSMYNTLHKYNL